MKYKGYWPLRKPYVRKKNNNDHQFTLRLPTELLHKLEEWQHGHTHFVSVNALINQILVDFFNKGEQ